MANEERSQIICSGCGVLVGYGLRHAAGCSVTMDTRRCIHCGAALVWNGEWSVWKCPNQHDDPRG